MVVLHNLVFVMYFILLSQKYKLLFLISSEEFISKIIKSYIYEPVLISTTSISELKFTRFYVFIGVCNDIVLQSRIQKFDFIHINFIFQFCNNKWFYIIPFVVHISTIQWKHERGTESKSIFPERQREEGYFFQETVSTVIIYYFKIYCRDLIVCA